MVGVQMYNCIKVYNVVICGSAVKALKVCKELGPRNGESSVVVGLKT